LRHCRLLSTAAPAENVNLEDVQHHSSFSSNWWDSNGPMKGLHALNQVRVPFIRDGLISTEAVAADRINKPNVLEGLKILEVGCGGGILTEALAKLRADIVALEPSEKLLEVANNRFIELKNVQLLGESIEQHSQSNAEKYDAVVASEVLEHVKDQRSFLESCVGSLKPGGSIFVTTMNKTNASWLGGIIAAEHVLKLVPQNTHDWNLFISPAEVEKILKDANCHTVLTHGIVYEFWRNTCRWSRCTDINYALHAVKDDL